MKTAIRITLKCIMTMGVIATLLYVIERSEILVVNEYVENTTFID